MSSVYTFMQRSKWFSFMLILFFVGNGVLGQASLKEKQATRKRLMKYLARQENSWQITGCCPELAKDIDPDVSVESWMLEENFGLDKATCEAEVPLKRKILSNKTWSRDYSGKLLKDSSELKELKYIKRK